MLNANGSFTFTPAASFSGTATFTYKVNDGVTDSNTATVTITVNPVSTDTGKRMSGGGTVKGDDLRATHAFELKCDASAKPQNLQITWKSGDDKSDNKSKDGKGDDKSKDKKNVQVSQSQKDDDNKGRGGDHHDDGDGHKGNKS